MIYCLITFWNSVYGEFVIFLYSIILTMIYMNRILQNNDYGVKKYVYKATSRLV